MTQVVIGTAGHIDHGKTSLVRSLTGMETDVLIDEKKRGMTIDLGFAYLNQNITIIDVPGHEKFIKNMTAGAANIHCGLIVVAADDGIMPQTIEHIDILNILGIQGVWIAITKIDLIQDTEWIDLIELEIHEYLSSYNFKIFSCIRINNLSGYGVDRLKSSILSFAKAREINKSSQYFKMNIDRSFTKKGFGTVVTGTVDQGKASIGDTIEILPNNVRSKIRGIQTHGKDAESIFGGDRAAVNLLNVKLEGLHRGSVVASPGMIINTTQIAAKIYLIDHTNWVLKNHQRVRLHFGTSEIFGRTFIKKQKQFKNGQGGNLILKFESAIPVCLDDKFVIRSYSPMQTIGGGIVLYTNIDKNILKSIDIIPTQPKKRFIFLLEKNWEHSTTLHYWKKLFFKEHDKIETWCKDYNVQITDSNILFTLRNIEKGKVKVQSFLKAFHGSNSLKSGVTAETINSSMGWHQDFLKSVLNSLTNEKKIGKINDLYFLSSYTKHKFSKLQLKQITFLESYIKNSGLVPIEKTSVMKINKFKTSEILEIIYLLKSKNKVIEIGNKFLIHNDCLSVLLGQLKKYFDRSNELSIQDFKKIYGITRKTAIPLLEFLDEAGYTKRKKDNRILGPSLND